MNRAVASPKSALTSILFTKMENARPPKPWTAAPSTRTVEPVSRWRDADPLPRARKARMREVPAVAGPAPPAGACGSATAVGPSDGVEEDGADTTCPL